MFIIKINFSVLEPSHETWLETFRENELSNARLPSTSVYAIYFGFCTMQGFAWELIGTMCPETHCERECAPVTLTTSCYGVHATEINSVR